MLNVTGCAPSTQESSFCLIYQPVYMSKRDTEETKRQIDENNAAYEAACVQK
jgi:hypothetical protein